MNPLLTSPLRKEYNTTAHKSECPFCDLKNDFIIKKGRNVAVILNGYPYRTGHILVVTLTHKESLDELSDDELIESMNLVKESITALKKTYAPHGFNVGINLGEYAGGSVKHFHIHVVPRYKNDTSFITTTSETTLIKESLKETQDKLLKHFTE